MEREPKKPWKKNLYENSDYPDNYTDKSFLYELKKNVNVKEVSLVEALLGAGLVSQEMCVVVLFVVVFVYLYNEWIDPGSVFISTSFGTVVGYVAYCITFLNSEFREALLKDVRTVVIFLAFGYVLSPILKTLTDTISTDTIYAMTAFMMFIHLVFFDYGVSAAIVSSSLSLNAAIFGSVCLASRLPSSFHAFVLLTVAVECFVLARLLLSRISGSSFVLIVLIAITTYLLYTVSSTLTVLFACAVLFINILCPVWFLRWHHHKDNIYGPWDEAIVPDTEL